MKVPKTSQAAKKTHKKVHDLRTKDEIRFLYKKKQHAINSYNVDTLISKILNFKFWIILVIFVTINSNNIGSHSMRAWRTYMVQFWPDDGRR
jgi:uncharacterized protein YhbP (UPF0306 family)